MDTALLISMLVFAGTILFGSSIFYYAGFRRERGRLVEKIKGGTQGFGIEETAGESAGNDGNDNFFRRHFISVTESLGNIIKPENEADISNMRKNLLRAGYRKNNTLIIFYGMKILLAVCLPVCLFIFGALIAKAIPAANFMLYSVLLALLGFYLPGLWLRTVISERQRKILEGFPDVLDLMVVCVEAGMGLDAAIFRAGKEIELKNRVISEEFKLLSLELRAGKSRQDALRSLAMRVNLEDVNSLISLLIQTDRFGTSVAQALRVHSEAMRVKRYQMAEEIAAKLPVKLVFPLVLFIFPSLFVVILGPAMINIYRILLPRLGGQ
jgi:tight adherence protein C